MDFTLTADQEALRRAARELLMAHAGPAGYRAAQDGVDGTDHAAWDAIAAVGWTAVNVPEALGGLGLGLVELALLQEEAGRALLATSFFATTCLATPVVLKSGPGVVAERYLREVAVGAVRATVAVTERDGRWDARTVRCRARADADGWVLSGTKAFVPDAHLADEIVVAARTHRGGAPEEGISLFLVPRTALRVLPRPAATVDGGRRLCEVSLNGVRLPPERLLGEPGQGWQVLAAALDHTVVALSSEAVGVASTALELATTYAKERVQFGHPIGSYQAVSHRCADMYALTESARSATYYAAWTIDEGAPDAARAAATAKVASSEASRHVTTGSIQVHGGVGFTWEHDAHLYYRRGRFCETFLGDASHWRERVVSLRLAS